MDKAVLEPHVPAPRSFFQNRSAASVTGVTHWPPHHLCSGGLTLNFGIAAKDFNRDGGHGCLYPILTSCCASGTSPQRRALSMLYVSNKSRPRLPLCPSCSQIMRLAQKASRIGDLPDLWTFECRACGVSQIEVAAEREGISRTMAKSSTREWPRQRSEQPQPRRRNAYDYDGEYEFPTVQHWTAPVTRAPFASRPLFRTSE